MKRSKFTLLKTFFAIQIVFLCCAASAGLFSKDSDSEIAKRIKDQNIEILPSRFSLIANDPLAAAILDPIEELQVSIGLQTLDYRNIKGIALYVKMKNIQTTTSNVTLNFVKLVDGEGFGIEAEPLNIFLQRASQYAGTPPPTLQDKNYFFSGSITSASSGNSSYFSGVARAGNPYDMSSGITAGLANARRRVGQDMIKWASSSWLKNTYLILPNESQIGSIFFNIEKVKFPLTMTIKINDTERNITFPSE